MLSLYMDFDQSVYCFLTQADYTNLFRSLDLYQTIYFDQLTDCPMTNSGILSRGQPHSTDVNH